MYASSILLITIPATVLYFQAQHIKEDRAAAEKAIAAWQEQVKEHGAESTQAAISRVTAEEMADRYNAAFDHFSGKWLVKLLKLEPISIISQ